MRYNVCIIVRYKYMKILIVEDHEIIAKNISRFLQLEWYEASYVTNCTEASKKLLEKSYDLMILDLNLPDKNGKVFCQEIRLSGNMIPVIMLTSSDTQKDIIAGLKSGADDYIAKPFDYDELLLRVQTILRRSNISQEEMIQLSDIEIDLSKKQVKKWEQIIYLSTLEYRLFEYLVKHRWRVIGRNELYEEVWWEYDTLMFSRTVDVYVNYVRKKLGKDVILTRKGEWYYTE